MGTPYESIPPEREIAYLQNAAEAANQAAEPVVDELGKLAVVDATEATDLFAQEAAKIGTDADRFVQENDLSKQFSEAVEEARTDGVGDQAERYANFMADAYAAVDGDSRKALKYHLDKAMTPYDVERLRIQYAANPDSIQLSDYDRAKQRNIQDNKPEE